MEELKKVLKKIAKINGRQIDIEALISSGIKLVREKFYFYYKIILDTEKIFSNFGRVTRLIIQGKIRGGYDLGKCASAR